MSNPNMQGGNPNAFGPNQPPSQFGTFPVDPRISGVRGPPDGFQMQQQVPGTMGNIGPQQFQGPSPAQQQQQFRANDGWNGLSVLHQTPPTADGGPRPNPGLPATIFNQNNPNMPQQPPTNVQQQQFPPQQVALVDQ